MAKEKVNKSQAIRDEFEKQGIEASSKSIMEGLKTRGIEVSDTLIYANRTRIKAKANDAPTLNVEGSLTFRLCELEKEMATLKKVVGLL